jgi:hypothetical protein
VKFRALVLSLLWCVSVHASERGLEPVFLYYIGNSVQKQIKASGIAPSCADDCCQLRQVSFKTKDIYSFLGKFPEGKKFVDEFQKKLSEVKSGALEIRYLNSLTKKERNELIEIGTDPDGLMAAYLEPGTIGNKNHVFLLTSGLNLAEASFLIVHEGQHRINLERPWKTRLREEEISIQQRLEKKYGSLRDIEDADEHTALQAALGMDAIYGFIDEYHAYQRESAVREQVKAILSCYEENPDLNAERFELEKYSERARLFQRYSGNKLKVQVDAALNRIENSEELKKLVQESGVSLEIIREAARAYEGFVPRVVRF